MKVNELKAYMTRKGYTQEEMAKKLNMSKNTFNKKLNNAKFGCDEAIKLSEILEITDPADIFLSKK